MGPVSIRPSAESIKKGLPDLRVEALRVQYRAQPGKKKIPAVVTAKVHNIGATSSRATRLHCSVQNGRHRREKIMRLQALKRGRYYPVKWSINLRSGVNIIVLRVDDLNNPSNNQAAKTIRIKAQPVRHAGGPPIRGVAPKKEGNISPFAKVILPGRSNPRLLHPDLTISRIRFNDFRARKADETWAQVKIRNIGTAISPKTWLLGTIKRADGTVERNRLPVPPVRPRQSTIIEGPIRMTPGLNALTVEVRDSGAPGNNSMTRRHRFGISAGKHSRGKGGRAKIKYMFRPEITARPDGESLAKGIGSRSVSRNAAASLGTGKAAAMTKKKIRPIVPASEISTRDQGLQQWFQAPRYGEVLCLGQPYTIKWHINENGTGAISHLGLRLDAVDSQLSLTIVSELAATARSYVWPVNRQLPPGHYQLFLTFQQGEEHYSSSVLIRLDRVRFHLSPIEIEPAKPGPAKVDEPVTVSAMLTSVGADALHSFTNQIVVTGPSGFNHVCLQTVNGLRSVVSEPYRLACQFVPPFYGMYKAVVQVDSRHNYPGSISEIDTQCSVKHINVNPLPDLLLYMNKVPDDRGNIKKKHFHIHVKNIGWMTSPATTVTFFLTGTGHHHYQVPSLDPGQTWEHDYTHRKWSAGEKDYWAVVDPDNRIEESDETNNRVEDQFCMYDAGAPVPQQESQPPELVVEAVYGLNNIVVGKSSQVIIRLVNRSPDRQVYFGTKRRDDLLFRWNSKEIYSQEHIPDLFPGEWYDLALNLPAVHAGTKVFCVWQKHWEIVGSQLIDCAKVQSKWKHIWHEIVDDSLCTEPVYKRRDRRLFRRDVTVRPQETTMADTLRRHASLFRDSSHQNNHGAMHILQPMAMTFWEYGQTAQIAWTGTAVPPYSLYLIPLAAPGNGIRLAENLSGNSFAYRVADTLEPGRYRVSVRWSGGSGLSDIFMIRAESKPDLSIKAASVYSSYYREARVPYMIHVRAVVENRGGFEAFPFQVAVRKKKKGASAGKGASVDITDPLTAENIAVPPMGNQQVFPVSMDLPVKEAGTYEITIKADATNKVDEVSEENNMMVGRCTITPRYVDLELAACSQFGHILQCLVQNKGDVSDSPEIETTFLYRVYATVPGVEDAKGIEQSTSRYSFYLGELAPGQSCTVTTVIPRTVLRNGGKYRAEMFSSENNEIRGVVVPEEENISSLKDMFKVLDRTSRQAGRSEPGGGCDGSGKLHFRFTIENNPQQFQTPVVEALLVVKENGRVVATHVFTVPVLSPRRDGKEQREFMVDWPGVSCRPGMRLQYSLYLRWQATSWLVASGGVQVAP